MSDRDDTHEDAINGEADAQGTEGLDGTQSGDDVECFGDELDSETAALLGASLQPVDPPAAIRASLLETIAREPQTERADQAEDTAEENAGDRDAVGGSNGGSGSDGDSDGDGDGDTVGSEVLSLDAHRRRRSAWRTGLLRAAAAVVLLGVGIGVGRWSVRGAVDEAMDSMATSMASTQHYAHLNQAQDVQRVTDTMPDGHIATLTWSEDMSMTALSLPSEMMDAAAGGGLQVWLRKGDAVSSLGLYDPASGTGFTFLDLMPEPGEQVFITQEPAGGSEQPTGEVLVAFDVNADGTTTRQSPSAPETGGADA